MAFSYSSLALLLALPSLSLGTDITILPNVTTGSPTALFFMVHTGVALEAYVPLANSIQAAVAPTMALFVNIRDTLEGVETTQTKFTRDDDVGTFVWGGHSMTDGGVLAQRYAREQAEAGTPPAALFLLNGFLQRHQRPMVRDCLEKAQYKVVVNSTYPHGYLENGLHDCHGDTTLDYPVRTLSIGGELDGVVRLARFAEAQYTQQDQSDSLPVVVVSGLNHAICLDLSAGPLPDTITSRDLRAEVGGESARAAVATAIGKFLTSTLKQKDKEVLETDALLAPLVAALVDQESSWYLTGADEEHNSSPWAASAQAHMADPLPAGKGGNYTWSSVDEAHLLSDDPKIAPYYRSQHRANVSLSGLHFTSSTVSQLRYFPVSVVETSAGLNGTAIILEELLNVLLAIEDDGMEYVSAIEIATKMVSRQKVFNITGNPSPESLDDGDRCAAINEKAVQWAAGQLSQAQKDRFDAHGVPMVMVKDIKPFPPAGPWFIWNYLQYKETKTEMQVGAYYAFYSLASDPYGAGNHYCKLLSPARALEWFLTDGLRANYQ